MKNGDQISLSCPGPQIGQGKRGQPPKLDLRALVNAIFYIVRSGCAWRLLPKDFGPWRTVYGYFRDWSQEWTWTFIHDTLARLAAQERGPPRNPDGGEY